MNFSCQGIFPTGWWEAAVAAGCVTLPGSLE